MKITTKLLATCIMLALLAIATAAQAEIIYQASGTPEGNEEVCYSAWYGEIFKTDANSCTLNSVTLGMSNATDGTGGFFVKLYDGEGEWLMDFNGEANPALAGFYTYSGDYALDANSTYMIATGATAVGGTFNLDYLAEDAQPVTGKYLGYVKSSDQGASYNFDVGFPSVMTINATKAGSAVPEASTLIGFGSALAMAGPGMVGYLRRRRA